MSIILRVSLLTSLCAISRQEGKTLKLRVRRGEEGKGEAVEEIERSCDRKPLKLSPVQSEVVAVGENDRSSESIGVIRVQSFTTETRDEVMRALDSFHHR